MPAGETETTAAVGTLDGPGDNLVAARMFLRRFPGCRSITVVTRDARAELEMNGAKVTAIPLWQYLLRE